MHSRTPSHPHCVRTLLPYRHHRLLYMVLVVAVLINMNKVAHDTISGTALHPMQHWVTPAPEPAFSVGPYPSHLLIMQHAGAHLVTQVAHTIRVIVGIKAATTCVVGLTSIFGEGDSKRSWVTY